MRRPSLSRGSRDRTSFLALLTGGLAAWLLAGAPARAAASGCEPRRVAFTLALPEFDSPAVLTLPPGRVRAAAVLLHGSDVADQDGAVVFRDRVVSRPLKRIAERLACRGVATVRYNKRHVTGAQSANREAFGRLTLQDFAADAERALAAARARPELAGAPLFLVGWSEGTTVATDVAARRRDLAGLVLLAPVATGFPATLQLQWPRTARPYVERYARDGVIDADGIAAAAAGPGGALAQMYVGFLKGFSPDSRVNAAIDADHDGRIDLAREADPTFRSWFADTPGGGLGIYATGRALPGVAARLEAVGAPVLVLQGANDGHVDPDAARALATRRPARVSVRLFPGLGHSLAPAASPQEDALGEPDDAPLDAMAAWMLAHARRR